MRRGARLGGDANATVPQPPLEKQLARSRERGPSVGDSGDGCSDYSTQRREEGSPGAPPLGPPPPCGLVPGAHKECKQAAREVQLRETEAVRKRPGRFASWLGCGEQTG